jgi:hypothetical protein
MVSLIKVAKIPNARADLKKGQLNKLLNNQEISLVVREMASAILASLG